MRKIISKHKREKKIKTKQIIIGGLLMFVMLFSILGYSFQGEKIENSKKLNYNDFEFIEQNGFWFTNIKSFQFVFKYNPEQVEEINSELKSLENYYNQPLYISSEDSGAELEIYRNLFYQNQIVQRMQPACLEECEEDLPIKSCRDNFIIIKESEYVNIIQNESCVFIEGPQENLTMLADEFLFNILEIR